jgi:hypothetical protein
MPYLSGLVPAPGPANLPADGVACAPKGAFDIPDGDVAEMQDARGQYGVGAGGHGRGEMVQRTRSPTGDDRYGDRGPGSSDHLQVVAVPRPVRVHRVEQDLSRAQFSTVRGPLERIDPGAPAAAVRSHLEAAGQVGSVGSARVDRQDEDLPAEPPRDLADQLWSLYHCSINRHLVRPGAKEPVDVIGGANATTHRQRNEHLVRGPAHDLLQNVPMIAGRRDVQEAQLVRAGGVVRSGEFHRIARIPESDEVDSFDNPSGIDIEARDHPDGDGHVIILR